MLARVTQESFINGTRHLPGEVVDVDLEALGLTSLRGASNLEPYEPEPDVPIVPDLPFAVRAPGAPGSQSLAPGTRISGTGDHVRI